jgi:hypothetical protein
MPQELVVLHRSADGELDGAKLRGVLSAHLALERARSVREAIVYGLLALSLPVWTAAARPEWLSPDSRRLALAAWLVTAMGLALAFVAERRWQRRCLWLTTERSARPPS